MRRWRVIGHRAALVLLLFLNSAEAGPLEDGQAALIAGDQITALKFYLEAAKQGNAVAQFNVGVIYGKGGGVVPIDLEEASRWFSRAAQQGLPRAQSALGDMYFRGLGVTRNVVTAYMWQSLAAAQALPLALQRQQEVRAQMSKSEIAEAEKMIRSWKPKLEKPD